MTSPAENAVALLAVGERKAELSAVKTLVLAFLAGAFIAAAGVGATIASATVDDPSVSKLLGACVFPTGLAMIVFLGAELFTGNCLMVMPVLQQRIRVSALLRNWLLVYIGNLLGSVFIAALAVWGHTLSLFGNAVAALALSTAAAKVSLPFWDAFLRAIGCNILVCAAVWMSIAAKSSAGKVVSLYLPVMLFVLCGFEHCVANMYYIPAGLFAACVPDYLAASGGDAGGLTWGAFFLRNLLPVTLGNIVGGAGFIGLPMWMAYLKAEKIPAGAGR